MPLKLKETNILTKHNRLKNVTTIKTSDTLEHQHTVWPVPPGQWQPWTAVSALFSASSAWHSRRAAIGLKALCNLSFIAEAGAKHPFKRQFHTAHVGAGGCHLLLLLFLNKIEQKIIMMRMHTGTYLAVLCAVFFTIVNSSFVNQHLKVFERNDGITCIQNYMKTSSLKYILSI